MSRVSVIAIAAVLVLPGTGCVEKRVVSVRGGLTGLPGAQGGIQPEGQPTAQAPGGGWDRLLSTFDDVNASDRGTKRPGTASSAVSAAEMPSDLRIRHEDGSETLVLKAPSHVMYHLTFTLERKEYDLLIEQVLSERTKAEYRKRALDPMAAAKWLARRQEDIARLFATIPQGEQTPGVLMETIGPNMFRLRAPTLMRSELRYDTIDVIIERGEFRLLMIRKLG